MCLQYIHTLKMGKGKATASSRAKRDDKRELPLKGDGAEYAQVIRQLGDGRVEVKCMDKQTRMATIRGAIYRRTRITAGDWVLIGIRPFQTERADVLIKYTDEEVRQLRSQGLIETLVAAVHDAKENEFDAGDDVDFDGL